MNSTIFELKKMVQELSRAGMIFLSFASSMQEAEL